MIRSRYMGECSACEQPIQIGDLIIQLDDMPWAHVSCPPPAPTRPPCPSCWQVPSLSGACGCLEETP